MELVNNTAEITNEESLARTFPIVKTLLRSINYGYLQITIQDGKVVQIDKTEKFRFNEQKTKLDNQR